MKGLYFFLSIFSYFSTVHIHSFGYTHTHTHFLKGLPSFTFPINSPLILQDLLLKYPVAASSKALNWVFQISLQIWGSWEFISLAMVWKGWGGILSCQIGYKARTLGFLGECQGLHLLAYTQQESWPASQPECRRNNTYRPSWQVCIAFILSGAKRPGQGGFVPLLTRRGPSVVLWCQ